MELKQVVFYSNTGGEDQRATAWIAGGKPEVAWHGTVNHGIRF